MAELAKTYDPKLYEAKIYKQWEDSGAFKPSGQGEPFCIIMPPPNANGSLHWGHAVGYSLEDVITRYKRMRGFNTLWLPGTDHAGIETQFVYERDVLAPQGKSRLDFSPKEFYQNVMEFTLKQQGNILNQFRSMGFSADWSRLKFTLEQDIIDIVYDTFIQMYKDGLVYRGTRIVNWCTRCQAAFADIEVERREQTDTMYILDYGSLQIATVRPETIFGDVAVAVNPKDSRYINLVGKAATVPLVDRQVPIVADAHVDPKAGTGALKVTPGHDMADYEIGQRHKLPEISVIDFDGKLVNVPAEFSGLSIVAGRTKTVEALKAAGKIVKEEPITHAVGIHDRCGTVIEPLISEQWFMRVKPLNQAAITAFEKDIAMFPKRFTKIALNWLANEHDWCISRDSCWWGIRLPVYYKTSHAKDKEPFMIAKTEAEALAYYGKGNYRGETATFDTWFSSGQWPYAALKGTRPGDFETFYPTALMATAREILHKWVTRMVMFGLYKTKQIPFKAVYLWGLVTDEHGAKMSKSKGNVIDPLVMTAKYGTDALRMAGVLANTPGNDSPLGEKALEAQRNFCNKLWNVARFTISQVESQKPKATSQSKPQNIADEWILERLSEGIKNVSSKIDQYRLNEAANAIYHLLWDDVADWYIEASKAQPNPGVLLYALQTVLKLAHPFIPFVTEAIWQSLPNTTDHLLITSSWPKAPSANPETARQFKQVKGLVTEIRALVTALELAEPTLYYQNNPIAAQNSDLLKQLAGLAAVEQVQEGSGLALTSSGNTAWLAVDQSTLANYRSKLEARQNEATKRVEQLQKQLDNKEFTAKAPKDVIRERKADLDAAQAELKVITEQLQQLAKS